MNAGEESGGCLPTREKTSTRSASLSSAIRVPPSPRSFKTTLVGSIDKFLSLHTHKGKSKKSEGRKGKRKGKKKKKERKKEKTEKKKGTERKTRGAEKREERKRRGEKRIDA